MSGYNFRSVLCFGLLGGLFLSFQVFAVELLIDPHYQRGGYWNDPATTPVKDKALQFTTNNGAPLWVANPNPSFSTYNNMSFNVTPTVRPSGAYQWTDNVNGFVFGPTNTADCDLQLSMNSIVGFGGVYPTSGWPVLDTYFVQCQTYAGAGDFAVGFEAYVTNAPWLSELSEVLWSMEINLASISNRYTTGYNSGVNANQYNFGMMIQNLGLDANGNPKPGYGQFVNFGIHLYDDRVALPGDYIAPDSAVTGQGMMIYALGLSHFTTTGLQAGQWQTLKGDLYPYITNALWTAWTWSQTHPGQSNYCAGSTNFADYQIANVAQGWEVSGLSIGTMQSRNLSLQAYGVNFPAPNEFNDYFNRANTATQTSSSSPNLIGTNWTIATGSWAVNAYQLKQAGGSLAADQIICLNTLNTPPVGPGTNFSLQATIQLNTSSGDSGTYAGLVFNFQNTSNYYFFRYSGSGIVQLLSVVNGNIGGPLSVAGAFSPVANRPYTLTVNSCSPFQFSASIYDTFAGTNVYTNTVVDAGNSFQGGRGGLYANNNANVMRYDNFNLTVVSEVWTSPTVLVQPVASSNYLGCPLTLTAGIGGTPPPQLQWKSNGVNIPNATNQTLMFNNLQLTNAGSYVLYATNAAGWTNTAAAVVSLSPGRATDSFDRANTAAQTTNSSPNLIGSQWTIATGAWAITNSQLKQARGTLAADQIVYLNAVKTLNSVAGSSFTVQGTIQLAADFGGLVFNVQNAANYYFFRYAAGGVVQLISVVNGNIYGGIISVSGAFSPVVNRPYTLTVFSSSPYHFSVGIYDTVAGTTVYTNNVVDPWTSFQDGYGGFYANNNNGSLVGDDFSLTVAPAQLGQPTVLVQPVGGSNYLGCPLTLTAGIGGTPAPQLQWQFNGVTIPNATNQTLVFNNLQLANAGSYVLYATNAAGWTNTAAAVVSLSPGRATDSFDRANTAAQTANSSPNLIGSQWTVTAGDWAITNNQLKQARGSLVADQVIYLNVLKTSNSVAGSSFTVQGTIQLAADFGGLVFNVQNAANYYFFRYANNGLVQLISVFNGNIYGGIINVSGAFSPVVNRPYTLTVASSSPYHFSVGIYDTVAGTTVYTNNVVDPWTSFQGGYGGFYANNNNGSMTGDNFSLTVLPASPDFNRLSPPRLVGSGTVLLSFAGIPSFPYALDWATNLTAPIAWRPVITNQADGSGGVDFTNTSAAPQNFFRTRRP